MGARLAAPGAMWQSARPGGGPRELSDAIAGAHFEAEAGTAYPYSNILSFVGHDDAG